MIRIDNITKSFGKTTALKNVSLEIEQGQLFGLIGPDGAGKTTLMRLIISLLIADEGTITVNDLDVVKNTKKIKPLIGYMPGKFSLYTDLSVEENLHFFGSIHKGKEDWDSIAPIYSQLEPFKNRLAGRLSGGMKQKLALCCVLLHNPKLLILDEPTTGVDAISRKEFWNMLKHYQKEKKMTILVSTPYMDEAALCDKIALINEGQFMEVNTPSILMHQFPMDLYCISCENKYKVLNQLESIDLFHRVYSSGNGPCFTIKKESISKNELENILAQNNIQFNRINKTVPHIEDLFIHKMG